MSNHWFISCEPVRLLIEMGFSLKVIFWAGIEPFAMVLEMAERSQSVRDSDLTLDLCELHLLLVSYFSSMSIFVACYIDRLVPR